MSLTLRIFFLFNMTARFWGNVAMEDVKCEISKINIGYYYKCLIRPNQRFEINVNGMGYIRIQCYGIDAINETDLPEINFGRDFYEMRIENCPIVKPGFKSILDKFHIKKVKSFHFYKYTSNEIFRFNHFVGLESVIYLQLRNNIVHFDGNILKITINLHTLNLRRNRLILYDELFKHCGNLVRLDLSENNIQSLSNEVFTGLAKLTYLSLEHNKIKIIENDVFRDLVSLEDLRLSDNFIFRIDETAFRFQANLLILDLQYNKLGYVTENMFRNCSDLQNIHLERNKKLELGNRTFSHNLYLNLVALNNNDMTTIPENLFAGYGNLFEISLKYNKLKTLPKYIFNNLGFLETLYLDHNVLEHLHGNVFKTLSSLKILTLNVNRLKTIERTLLESLDQLQTLDLSFNQIHTIPSTLFKNKYSLIYFSINNNLLDLVDFRYFNMKDWRSIRTLNFANNSISQFPYEMMEILWKTGSAGLKRQGKRSKEIKVFMQKNNISEIKFNVITTENTTTPFPILVRVDISMNPINCDCMAVDLVPNNGIIEQKDSKNHVVIHYDNLFCARPADLANKSVRELDVNHLVCPLRHNCTKKKECDCFYKSATKTLFLDCSKRNLTEIPQLVLAQLSEYFNFVNLDNVEVHLEDNHIEKGPTENDGYNNITKLYLQKNNIRAIEWIPPLLQVLNLENNALQEIDSEVLKSLNQSSIKELGLANNPWSCDCTTKDFMSYLWTHILMIRKAAHIKCKEFEKPLVLMDEEEICPERTVFASVLSSVILICFIIISGVIFLYYIYQEEILIWLYARGSCLWLIKEERLDQNKKYDAFVSFAHQDEEFVMDRLLPILELGMPPYKLCVHVRDWIPGEYIATQISNSVRDSKRTLIILSPNFIKSVWGRMEFRTAHTSAMKEGRVRIILVIYGEVDMDQLDDELKAYIRTNTYIEWGDPWFWENLRYALPKTRQLKKNSESRRRSSQNDIELH